jgi:hypothetical protein
MRALVVYESMYGNTHTVALRIAEGLASAADVQVVAVSEATGERVAAADLVVAGGPTHIHGMTSAMTRRQAVSPAVLEADAKKGHEHDVDPDAEGEGLRDWFDGLDLDRTVLAAAFDTRMDGKPLVTGRASKGIARRMAHHSFRLVTEPESFLVDESSHLLAGEEERAVAWGTQLLADVAALAPGLVRAADG